MTVAISLGDPGGIGPEVTLKALDALGGDVQPLLVGSLDALRQHAERLGFDAARFVSAEAPVSEGCVPVLDVTGGAPFAVEWGRATAEGGRISMLAVEAAARLCLSGQADAMVTAPISKEAIALAGHDVPGHTEFIARLCNTVSGGVDEPLMLLVADLASGASLRVGLVTVHVPLRRVAELVTQDAIAARLGTMDAALQQDFGLGRPKIAVLGLNPHAGDGGILGDEEITTIRPAIEHARADGLDVHGPFPADGFFATDFSAFNGVLAMYHDQGLAPFKALGFDRGVNVTCGLPIVRTSPDHGTAYGIAGQGRADAGSMVAACRLAVQIARSRAAFRLDMILGAMPQSSP